MYQMSAKAYAKWQDADAHFQTCQTAVNTNKPHLVPTVIYTLIGPAGDKGNAIVGVVTRIINRGADGSAVDFWIDVKFDDGRDFHGQLAAGPTNDSEPVRFGKNVQGQTMSLPNSAYWLNQASAIIPRNGERVGFLMALVRGTTMAEMKSKNATVEFTCGDAFGAKSSDQHTMGEGNDASSTLGLNGLQKPIPQIHKRP